jgi:hypothetical protein
MARPVANIMARETGRGQQWIEDQVETFQALAQGYLVP